MHRRWLVNRTNPEFVHYLSKTVSISPVFAQILINRGLKTAAEIDSFLNPCISQLSDPFAIEGMSAAVERITAASKKGERVMVHGDYDVDGLSATAIVIETLKILGIENSYFIPNRMGDGYGFNPESVRRAKKAGVSLIITVDCGISSFEAASLCKIEGIDLIITDHHEPVKVQSSKFKVQSPGEKEDQEFLCPDAIAVINPKLSTPPSHLSNLSGAGIAFKLAHALSVVHNSRFPVHDFFDLAALGTMADVVPLTGENRLIVKEGLKLLAAGKRPGVQALRKVSGILGKKLGTGLLLFTLIPRINAAGRVSEAAHVVSLLLTSSEEEATALAVALDKLNTERQQIEEGVYQEALLQLKQKGMRSVIVLASEGWHKGVIGIVASRIAEDCNRPVFVLSIEGRGARGSARSIPSFDLYESLAGCKELLTAFGGHKQAAGLELDARNIPGFEECINRLADRIIAEEDFIPSIEIDAVVDLSDISFSLTKELELLEPFGFRNPQPLLGSKRLKVLYPKIVKDSHLKMKLKQQNQSLDAIGFNMAPLFSRIKSTNTVDAVFTPTVNEWDGQTCLQLNLKALRPSK